MMGQLPPDQNALFYEFCLENYVPQDHLLRQIDAFLDLSELRHHLSDFYSHTGRPSVDPEVMIRMLIVGYCYGIRSERRLCEEVHLNLATSHNHCRSVYSTFRNFKEKSCTSELGPISDL